MSKGQHGGGYALCLKCGRAAPMKDAGKEPDVFKEHRKLRRFKEEGNDFCEGDFKNWSVKKSIALGHDYYTDIFEIELKDINGNWVKDQGVAMTLAIAIRSSLASLIGVQTRELRCTTKESNLDGKEVRRSIVIFDENSAVYSTIAPQFIDEIFRGAAKVLDCPAHCESACSRCVLPFDQRFMAEIIDRKAALEILSQKWLDKNLLPDSLSYFGEDSQMELASIQEAIWTHVNVAGSQLVHLYVNEDIENGDVGVSSIRKLAYRLSLRDINVKIVIPAKVLSEIDDLDRLMLTAMLGNPGIKLFTTQHKIKAGEGWLIADSDGTKCWATGTHKLLDFSEDWGVVEKGDFLISGSRKDDSVLTEVNIEDLVLTQNEGSVDVRIHHELDGPIMYFGKRFWDHLIENNSSALSVLSESKLVGIRYADRYLRTPMSLLLLFEVFEGLRNTMGNRWSPDLIKIETAECDSNARYGYKVFDNWSDTSLRDAQLNS